MHIEHSPPVTEFAALRFGTSVDGSLRYETVGHYLEGEWQTRLAGSGGLVQLSGPFTRPLG